MYFLSQERGPLVEGMEGNLACLWPKEGEAKNGSTCGQTPGKGRIGKSTFEGHAEDFELAPKSHGESLESLGAGMTGESGLNLARTLWLQCGEWMAELGAGVDAVQIIMKLSGQRGERKRGWREVSGFEV